MHRLLFKNKLADLGITNIKHNQIFGPDGSKWTVRRLRRRARSSSLRRDKSAMAVRALNNNKEDQDHDEKDVDTTEGASANHEVTHGELYQQEINNCTGPVVNQVMK